MNNLILNRAIALHKRIADLKKCYSELDEITAKLKKQNFKSQLLKNYSITLVDNFAKSNVAFRTTSVKRFELHIEAPQQKRNISKIIRYADKLQKRRKK